MTIDSVVEEMEKQLEEMRERNFFKPLVPPSFLDNVMLFIQNSVLEGREETLVPTSVEDDVNGAMETLKILEQDWYITTIGGRKYVRIINIKG